MYLASCSDDKTVKLWNLKSLKLENTFEGHTKNVHDILFSKCGKYLASCSWDKTVKLWNLESLKLEQTFEGHKDYVNSI